MNPLLTLANEEEAIRHQELEDLESYRKGTADAPELYRSGYISKADDSDTMDFVASDESPDRYEDEILAKGWQLANFRKNPVFLFAHNNHIPPVGKVVKVGPEGTQLLATVQWDMNDELGVQLQSKYANKFMRAVSVGFRPLEFEFIDGGNGIRFTKQELLELSAVPVPAQPKAMKKMFGELEVTTGPLPTGPEELKAWVREAVEKQADEIADLLERMKAVEKGITSSEEIELDISPELLKGFDDMLAAVATKE